MKLLQRISAAVSIIAKGSIAPFDRIPGDTGGLNVERIRDPYSQSLWVHAAIQHIARPIQAVDLEFYRGGGGDVPVEDPRLEMLWANPAKNLRGLGAFVLASIGWRKLAGECFWILDDTTAVPFPEVVDRFPQVIVARPDRMQHIVADGELVGWRFTDASGRSHLLLANQVIHLKQWNPVDEWRGLGTYEAARITAEAEFANERFARSLAESNGDQGVYVVAKSGIPDDAQKAQILASLREKRALQQKGIFKPAFLVGDISVQDPQVRSADLAFLDGSRMNAEKIFVAFGVPPSMTSKAQSYSIGSASDYYRLILDTCIPEADELEAGIARVSSILTGMEVEACFDWDEHPVMQEVRKERLSSADGLWAKGMPMAQVSEYLRLGLPRFTGDDVGYLPFSVSPVGMDSLQLSEGDPGASTATPTAVEVSDPIQEALRILRCGHAVQDSGPSTPVCRSPKDLALWRSHMTRRRETVRAYERSFTRELFKARAEVLRRIENLGSAGRSQMPQDRLEGMESPGGDDTRLFNGVNAAPGASESSGQTRIPVSKAGAVDLIFDLSTLQEGLKAAFRKAGSSALDSALTQLAEELGRKDPLRYPPEAALQFLRARENRLSGIAEDVFDRIKAVLEDGLDAGDPIDVLAKRVRSEFNEIGSSRATTIAMTETAAAYGTARQTGMEQAGVGRKQWLTSGGDNVRPAHEAANRQVVGVEEPFVVGGEELRFPGDPSGSPENVINCHCVAIAIPDEPTP
jgi:hypothetical protein